MTTSLHRWRYPLAAVMLVSACAGAATNDATPAASTTVAALPHGVAAGDWAAMRARIDTSRYRATASKGSAHVSARNPQQDIFLRFGTDGASFTSARNADETVAAPSSAHLRLVTRAFRRDRDAQPVRSVLPQASGHRIEYRHAGWTEWYVNRVAGIEHGYTLHERPLADTEGKLRIVLAVTGLAASQADEALRFSDAAGRSMHYGKLLVEDADGKRLPATLSAPAPDRIEIAFDDSGARYPVVVDPLLVNEEQEVDTSNPEKGNFGFSVALQGDVAVIGAPYESVGGNGVQGAAYVFRYTFIFGSGFTWALEAQLTASDGAAGDNFGWSVALDGDTVLVGARSANIGPTTWQGAAYAYTHSGGNWTEQAKLVASNGSDSDRFGQAVALDGDTAVIGAPLKDIGADSDVGAVYVFTRAGSSWFEQDWFSYGEADDNFGHAVAIHGDTALIGAPNNDATLVGPPSFNQGAAYIFTRTGTSWSIEAGLLADDGDAGDRFGWSAALDNEVAVIGAPNDDIGPNASQGSAYIFAGGTSWDPFIKLMG